MSTVGPPYTWVLCPRIQPTVDQKYLKKGKAMLLLMCTYVVRLTVIASVVNMVRLFFLSFPKQCSVRTIYIVLGIISSVEMI